MRKIFRKAIGPQSVSDFDNLLEQDAAGFVQRLSGFSGDPLPIIQEYAFLDPVEVRELTCFTFSSVGSFVVKLTYGEKVYEKHGEELIKLNTETLDLVTWALSQIWIVNLFPLGTLYSKSPSLQ
jgi:hypothetical protein